MHDEGLTLTDVDGILVGMSTNQEHRTGCNRRAVPGRGCGGHGFEGHGPGQPRNQPVRSADPDRGGSRCSADRRQRFRTGRGQRGHALAVRKRLRSGNDLRSGAFGAQRGDIRSFFQSDLQPARRGHGIRSGQERRVRSGGSGLRRSRDRSDRWQDGRSRPSHENRAGDRWSAGRSIAGRGPGRGQSGRGCGRSPHR